MQLSDQPGPSAGEGNLLASMVERARGKGARLSAEEEKESARLVKESLLSGKGGVSEATEALVQLPWSVGVEALTAAWPEMKPAGGRRQFMAAIGTQTSDQAHRVRLSLARGLYGIDPAAGLKLLLAVCEEMRTAEGKLPPKDRGMFSQVLIGKAKPWITNIALGELKPAESAQIVGAVLDVVGTCAPAAQEALLTWLAASGQLGSELEPLLKVVGRWKAELRQQFLSKNLELPEALAAALAAAAPEPKPAQKPEPKPEPKREQKPRAEEKPRRKAEENGFDLGAALRQIDAHVKELRGELSQAKNALRQREGPRQRSQPSEEIDVEGLRRHNLQLEETVQQLRQQLEDLASHDEDLAQSRSASEDPTEQFKELLKIKLQRDYADFKSLALEPPDEVFREHYRILLENVFGILGQQGVKLE